MATTAPPNMYHRWVGDHAPALRRFVVAAVMGALVAAALAPFVKWEVALLGGWDACALAFVTVAWSVILRCNSAQTQEYAMREDDTRATARSLVVASSLVSLFAVVIVLGVAGDSQGGTRVIYIATALLTVVLSWVVINTLFTLRYADLYFASRPNAIDFGTGGAEEPDYRDFAYVAFTIGMTYQVADTTLRDRRVRRTVLRHALISYLFGVVIVAACVNLVSGLAR